MAKQNYSKTEKAVGESLQGIKVEHLLELADLASGKKADPSGKEQSTLTPGQMIKIVGQNLKWLHKFDPDIYKRLKIKKSTIKKFEEKIHDAKDQLEEKELELLKVLMKKIAEYKEKNLSAITDEKIIEGEAKKHINKRHNVNEKWLPLK
ncbi:MAG: hypothetical protein WB791_06370 [Waddliaceae bacterium]